MSRRDPIRIAVLISGGGTNLQALLDAESSGILKSGRIELVAADREDAYGLVRAERCGRKTCIATRKGRTSAEFEADLLTCLQAERIELVILAGFLQILSKQFIDAYPDRILNVHPSLIPSFSGEGFYGLRVHEAALARGVKITGATVHFVNEITDGGRILLQKAVEVCEGDTPEQLQRRVMEQAEWILLPEAAEQVCRQLLNREAEVTHNGNE